MSTKDKIFKKYPKLEKIYNNWTIFNERIDKHHLFMVAAGIAFNIIIYLIPLFLVAIYVVSMFLDESSIIKYIEALFAEWLPPTNEANSIMNSILTEVGNIADHSSIFGIVGIAVLLWISSFLVSSLRTGLNAVFQISSKRIFIFYRLKDILLTILISILILVYSYIMPLVNFLEDLISKLFPDILQGVFSDGLLLLFSAATSFIVFFIIYALVPNKKLPWKIIRLSTIICMIAIELSRHVFAWYITGLSNYGKFYGTYAVVVSHAIWIYYSSLIILLSAEISKFYFDIKDRKIEKLKDFLKEESN